MNKYNNSVYTKYDINGNLLYYKDTKTQYEEWYQYDENGNKIYTKNSEGCEMWYNKQGRVIRAIHFHHTEDRYDENGNIIYTKNSEGCEMWYNKQGRVIRSKDSMR